VGLACGTAVAGDVFWQGGFEGRDWHTPTNWVGGVLPTAEDVAVFDSGQNAVHCWAFQVSNHVEVAGLRFAGLPRAVQGTAIGNGALTIGAEGVAVADGVVMLEMPLTLAAAQTWAVAEGAELLSEGDLSGEGLLTKDGEGRVWLMGRSAFAGEVRVAAGTLKASWDDAMPVTDGLAVWLDASAMDTVVTNSAGVMTAWANRMGGSAMTAVPGGGPLWVADALAGKPAARFSNAASQGMVMESGYANTTNCATAFIVVQRRPQQTPNTGLLSIYRNGEQDFDQPHAGVFFHLPENHPRFTVKGYRSRQDGGYAYFPFETPVCFMSRYNGTSHVITRDNPYQRGSNSTQPNMGLPFDANRVVLANRAAPANGSNYPFNGDISEVLLYNRALTEAEERCVFAYLNAKWAMEPSLEAVLNKAVMHFDAARPDTILTNEFGEVLAWTNSVPLEESMLVPQTAGQNPLYVTGDVPSVRFDKDLTNALHLLQNRGYMNYSRSATLFAVVTPREVQVANAGIASIANRAGNGVSDYSTGGCAVLLGLQEVANGELWRGEQGGRSLSAGYVQPERVSVVMSSFDKGMHTVRVNGAFGRPPVVREVDFEADYLRVGNRIADANGVFTFNGDVHEILVFNCPLSADEIALLTEHLNTKWRKSDDIDALLADADVRFDASDEASVTTNALGTVTALQNLNANSFAEIPAFGQCDGPLYVSGAKNGLPVLRFRGALSNALMVTSGYTNSNAFLTAFAVVRCTENSGGDAGLLSVVRHDMRDFRYVNSAVVMFTRSGRYDDWAAYRDDRERAKINDVPFGNPFLLMSRFDGIDHTLALNGGGARSVVASSGRFDADRILLGARQVYETGDVVVLQRFLSCDVAEVLVYNRAVTPQEADLIHAYLREKWCPEMFPDTLPELLDRALIWLDASDTGTVTRSPQGRVTAWENRNNSANVFVPPPGCDGPVFLEDGINGLPAFRFDIDLSPRQMLWCESGYALTTTAATAVVLMKPRETQINNGRLIATWKDPNDDHNTPDGAALLYYTTSNGGRWQTYRSTGVRSYCTNVVPETPTCLISRFDGYNHRIIKDGKELCSIETSSGMFNANRFAVGGRRTMNNQEEWFNGDVAEVLLFDYALSPDQYQTLTRYLTAKWLTPPDGSEPDGTQDIEVCAGATLDVRGAEMFTMQDGAKLKGAGTVLGGVAMANGSSLQALGTLTILGDLSLGFGSTLLLDYSGGLRPLVSATGQLVLEEVNAVASAMVQATGSATLPILQGGTGWQDGNANTPDPGGWTLTGGVNGAKFSLDPSAYRVNIKLSRGTILMLK